MRYEKMPREELIQELEAWKNKFDDELKKATPQLLAENQELKSKIARVKSILSYHLYKNEGASKFNLVARIKQKIANSILNDIKSTL